MTDYATSPEPPPKPADARASVTPPDFEPRSSVKITVNAKGHRQWEIKVVAGAETPEAITAAANLARDIDRSFVNAYGLPGKEQT